MLAQGRARVVVSIYPAFLEFRDEEIHQLCIIVGRVKRWRNLKAVAAARFEEVLHGVRHPRRGEMPKPTAGMS